jgi:hypothetical protein
MFDPDASLQQNPTSFGVGVTVRPALSTRFEDLQSLMQFLISDAYYQPDPAIQGNGG